MLLTKGTIIKLKSIEQLRKEKYREDYWGFKSKYSDVYFSYPMVALKQIELLCTVDSSTFTYRGWNFEEWMLNIQHPKKLEIE